MPIENELDFYSRQSIITDPGEYADLFDELPNSVHELCKVIHGILIHRECTKYYGFSLPEKRKMEADTRYVEKILARIQEMDRHPLQARIPEKRFVGVCRDFAIMLCSMLRHHKIPARVRCGFGAYFEKGFYYDHWVTEYWNGNKWILVDPQIDGVIKKVESVKINPENVSRKKFLVAGRAWQMCMAGSDPEKFGVHGVPGLEIKGLWFVRANVLRDLAALNKIELLPWDYWKFADKQFKNLEELPKKEIDLISKIAHVTNEANFEEIRSIYKGQLRVPKKIKSYTIFGPKEVVITSLVI